MRILLFMGLLAACGGQFEAASDMESPVDMAAPSRASRELAWDLAVYLPDMEWDPSAYPDVCNSGCPGGTGGHSLK